MWLSFSIGIVVCIALLYAPGFFLFRAVGFDSMRSLVLAPIASVFAYFALAIVYAHVGLSCSWATVALPACIVFFIAFAIRKIIENKGDKARLNAPRSIRWPFVLLYTCFGIVIGIYAYAIPLGSPEHFLQGYDNAFHMQVVRGFMDSGNWSVLEVGKYMTEADLRVAPFSASSFYPALWHILCAMLGAIFGSSVPFAINVVNFTMAAVLFPLSMISLASTIFTRKRTIMLGTFCTVAFVAFPWMLLYWGPLYPNAFAFTLAPLAASLFVKGFSMLMDGCLKARVVFAFLLSVVVLVVAQTSTVFFCIILLTPYCVYRIWTLDRAVVYKGITISRWVLELLFIALVVVVWTTFAFAPFMLDMVFGYNWPARSTVGESILSVLQLQEGWIPPQRVLAVVVLVGIATTCKQRKYLWLSVAYLIFGLIFVLCASTEGFPKHFLGGFWYTDSYRVFACLAIAGIPLSMLGLSTIVDFLERRLVGNRRVFLLLGGVVMIAFCLLVYRPGMWVNGAFVDSAFGKIRWEYTQGNDHNRPSVFTSEEQEFVDEVMEIVPDGALVLNMPDDGSVFAYATDGLRTYYRDYRDYEDGEFNESSNCIEASESKTMRKGAAQIMSNEEVQAAFEKLGIRYVLILGYGDALDQEPKVNTYDPDLWTGLRSITDETPGFSIVLSRDDMRLYRVEL